MNEELRCYTFTDFMLRPIQQGIQPGHAALELVNKYMLVTGWQNGHAETIADWIGNHKTLICLNGGMYGDVVETLEFLEGEDNPFPFTGFVEEANQGGNLTSVAVILPARIFETSGLFRRLHALPVGVEYVHDKRLHEHRFSFQEDNDWRHETFTEWEFELMHRLSKHRLAA